MSRLSPLAEENRIPRPRLLTRNRTFLNRTVKNGSLLLSGVGEEIIRSMRE